METMENKHKINTNTFKSPRKSSKPVWAPMNGVFTQNTLLSNPELAKQNDIHFIMNNSPQLTLNSK